VTLSFGVHYRGRAEGTSVVAYARRLEALGLDGFWASEGALGADPLPILATAAAATDLRIGSGVVVMPFREPVATARAVATLDQLSGGRFTFGIGVGGERLHEFAAYGVEPRLRGPRTNEALALMQRLWREDDVDFEGRFFRCTAASLAVRCRQEPHPPVWVGGRLGGQGKSRDAALRRAARYGDGWLPYLVTPEQFAAGSERLAAYAAERGRGGVPLARALQINAAIYPTTAEAIDAAMEGSARGYGLSREQVQRYYAAGTVSEVIDRLTAFVGAGVQHFVVQWACRPEDVASNLDALAREVVPQLKRLPESR
jgi:probable F420-dependent oxidoreductase